MAFFPSQTYLLLFLLCSSAITVSAKKEKATHLHFYVHNKISTPNATAVMVAGVPSNNTLTSFGNVNVFDDPLTQGSDPSSKLVGRAQGSYFLASQQDVTFMLVMNVVFMEGKYNGSTLVVVGRQPISQPAELSVLGGSGWFRLARGYAIVNIYFLDPKTGDAIVEYNVTVLHYQSGVAASKCCSDAVSKQIQPLSFMF